MKRTLNEGNLSCKSLVVSMVLSRLCLLCALCTACSPPPGDWEEVREDTDLKVQTELFESASQALLNWESFCDVDTGLVVVATDDEPTIRVGWPDGYEDSLAYGTTDYETRIVWIRETAPQDGLYKIVAHELGHYIAQRKGHPEGIDILMAEHYEWLSYTPTPIDCEWVFPEK